MMIDKYVYSESARKKLRGQRCPEVISQDEEYCDTHEFCQFNDQDDYSDDEEPRIVKKRKTC
jgi:hypothetical protein